MEAERIAPVERVPDESTLVFTVETHDSGQRREAILIGTDDGVAGWLNYCRHFTHVTLDKGSGAPVRGDEIVCANHGAMFESESGRCTHGSCEGAYLEPVEVAVEDGAVYLVDDGYAFVHRGGVEDGDDLTSTSNVEF